MLFIKLKKQAMEIKSAGLPLGQFPAPAVKTHFLEQNPTFRWDSTTQIGAPPPSVNVISATTSAWSTIIAF
ncbi:hypothetical protein HMPREF9439_01142 [Parasutterella excrementihominis YIT 11859]|uniref:Uncharacterized protein n=1 Tax=Parasutterella excrementihominis YIT 11859 TaxID=762966 RepID=F3QJN9_9BURK|nr:hypothetical protein HMPREF9439_01142 [Parasutterella excrementihominis YIT 11859]